MNKLKEIFLIIVIIVNVSVVAKAQFFVEINTGYAAPLYYVGHSKIHETNLPSYYRYYDNTLNIDTSYYTQSKFNMGKGVLIGGELGYKLNRSNWAFSINFLYLNNKDIDFFYEPFNREIVKETVLFYNEDDEYYFANSNKSYSYYGERFTLTPKVSYFLIRNKFSFELSAGVSFSYFTLFRDIELNEEHIHGNVFF